MSDSELQWVEAPPVRPSQPSTTDSARRRSHSPSTSSRKNCSRRDDGRRSRTHDDHDDREDRRRRDRSRSRDRDREGGRSGRDAEWERDRDRDGDRDRDRSRSRDRRRHRSPSRDRDSRRDRDGGRASKSHRSSRRRSRSRSRSDSDSDGSDMSETRSERRARKKEKKERKREKKEKKKAASTIGEWGKYGLIDDNDREHKENEFRAWMVEERKINPETIKKDRERKEWAAYVEDFNTATLPHLKYVNMAAHMAKMDAIRSGGTYDEFGSSSYDPNADMAAHSNALRRPVVETETYLSQAQLAELRRVQNERIEMGKRKTLGLEVKRDLGVRMDGSKFDKR